MGTATRYEILRHMVARLFPLTYVTFAEFLLLPLNNPIQNNVCISSPPIPLPETMGLDIPSPSTCHRQKR